MADTTARVCNMLKSQLLVVMATQLTDFNGSDLYISVISEAGRLSILFFFCFLFNIFFSCLIKNKIFNQSADATEFISFDRIKGYQNKVYELPKKIQQLFRNKELQLFSLVIPK